MMKMNEVIIFIFLNLSLLLSATSSNALCSNSKSVANNTLQFCNSYTGQSCCDSKDDLELQNRFNSMKISDPNCSSLLKSILCSKCDQFSGELFRGDDSSLTRPIPILCNSTSQDICSNLWETCQNISIISSPFAPTLLIPGTTPSTSSNSSKLTDLWKSKTEFCTAFGGSTTNKTRCFNGGLLNDQTPPKGICLEKIATGSYLNMVPHPDGSNRAFFSNQPGKIWLGTLPDQDSGESLEIDESSPFVDITDQVSFDTQFGMMGMAFHPDFAVNGRFFASFNCDKVKSPGCSGRCACNSDVNCDPSKLPKDDGAQPCRYQTVVAEYTANGTSSTPSTAKSGKASEVRRIFTMGLPYMSSHGGQILFGPNDGFLYLMTGDGGGTSDTHNFAQNKKSLLGKILRLDVDKMPSVDEISKLGLWGNYSIPKDNPFQSNEDEEEGEIWALGLRNPWRCSFDSQPPHYFMCADVGKDTYEEVDIIKRGGNYGWRMYEGPYVFSSSSSSSSSSPFGDNTTSDYSNLTFPILGYNHSQVNKREGSASIIGGYFYRSTIDPCTYNSYLYADLYANAMWAAIESSEGSGKFTTSHIPFKCSEDSPMKCTVAPGGGGGANSGPALGYIYSFGEDNNKDIYLLTSSGVYRIVRPSRCNFVCSKENTTVSAGKQSPTAAAASPPPQSLPSHATKVLFCGCQFCCVWFFVVVFVVHLICGLRILI